MQKIFLDQFEARWRSPLLEFGKRISESDADILVFMARKAACLYYCLGELKLTHTDAICTSDLALEGDLSWLKGKRVTLIDDTLITGTTLYLMSQKLKKAGVDSLNIMILCADKDNWCRDLVDPIKPYILTESYEVTNFSSQLVRAIGMLPRPYLIDFPLFEFIRLPGHSLDPVLSATGWEVDDVTSIIQKRTGASSITVTPSDHTVRSFDQRLGWKCSEFAQLIKLRLYTKRTPQKKKGKYFHFCRVLPIVAFDPLAIDDLNRIWDIFESNLGENATKLGEILTNSKQRLRVLQYFCATNLFQIWMADIRKICGPDPIQFQIDSHQISFCFPPSVQNIIIELLQNTTIYPLNGVPKIFKNRLPNRPSFETESRFTAFDLPGIQAKLTEPFEMQFMQRELPARRLVKKYGKSAFDRTEYKDLINRLNQGISLPELRDSLSCLGDTKYAKSFVSMFIDDAIDRGVAVPIIVDDGNYIYRAFRHGEDVKFTEIEERLICIMIKEFSCTLDQINFSKIIIEKLIVLLIKGGLSRGFIERWMGRLGDRKSAGVRFYLQGAVVQKNMDNGAPYHRSPYHYEPGESLTQLLKGRGSLSKTAGNKYKVSDTPPRPPTTTSHEADAKALGAAIGLALKDIPTKQQEDELIIVSTCLDPIDVLSALAADIYFFEAHWEDLSSTLVVEQHPTTNASLPIHKQKIYQAIKRGLWKWRHYRENTAVGTLNLWRERASRDLPNPSLTEAIFEAAFPPSGQNIDNTLKRCIFLAANWLIEAYITLISLDICLLSTQSGSSKNCNNKVSKFNIEVQKLKEERMVLLREMAQPENIFGLLESSNKEDCLSNLNRLSFDARGILDEVDAFIVPFGKSKEFSSYRHLLTLHLIYTEDNKDLLDEQVEQTVRNIIAEARMSKDGARIFILHNSLDSIGANFSVVSSGKFARKWLSRISFEVFGVLNSSLKFRICLWVDLEKGEHIFRSENTSDVLARNLRRRIPALNTRLPQSAHQNEIIVLSSSGQGIVADASKELLGYFNSQIKLKDEQDVILEEPLPKTFSMKKFIYDSSIETINNISVVGNKILDVSNEDSQQNLVRRSVFFSYASKDEELRDELEKHLKTLQHQGVISQWHKQKIEAGQESSDEIDRNLECAQIILLLVSPDFIASSNCIDKEVKRAMEKHHSSQARVIPILLRPADWDHGLPFSKLQPLPKNAEAVTTWPNQDSAFVDIARGIRSVIEEITREVN
jgi:TIR domain